MTSGDFFFEDILALAKGEARPPKMSELDADFIQRQLKVEIEFFDITNLTLGPDPEGVHNREQIDSLNHSVIYTELDDAGKARFSMENRGNAKKGTNSRGVLTVKFQGFDGASKKTTKSIHRPWNSRGRVVTLNNFVVMLDHMGASGFTMTTDLQGCRSWVQGILRPLIEAQFIDIDIEDVEMKWSSISTGHIAANKRPDKVIRVSLARMDEYFQYYFTTHGDKRLKGMPEGVWDKPLPSGQALFAYCEDQFPYLLEPEEEEDNTGKGKEVV
ncbi:hypothetical protein FIBSPDRAFT_1047133 [Athelia psychrophila]|uniref:DUF7770 domain-containing protein n=1 Tax=Athelia psychrophila TaxID=1759441 RepID=A0A166FPD8_9AGAM|nr:hypothetical protein FIBSPDRAFT_1047133 [Fibularhizoctonia sp. CBS 109695]